MTQLNGLFSMRTWQDLREKLEHDYERFRDADKAAPEAQYAAFDFFVTAEHLAEWMSPGRRGNAKQHRTYPDAALVSHVANGAKHFMIEDPKHQTVHDTKTGSAFDPRAFQMAGVFQGPALVIELGGGGRVPVDEVALRVLTHWRSVV